MYVNNHNGRIQSFILHGKYFDVIINSNYTLPNLSNILCHPSEIGNAIITGPQEQRYFLPKIRLTRIIGIKLHTKIPDFLQTPRPPVSVLRAIQWLEMQVGTICIKNILSKNPVSSWMEVTRNSCLKSQNENKENRTEMRNHSFSWQSVKGNALYKCWVSAEKRKYYPKYALLFSKSWNLELKC